MFLLKDVSIFCHCFIADGRLPIHWAAERGSLPMVLALMNAMQAAGLDGEVHQPDNQGMCAAQLAAAKNHIDVVARLLEAGRPKEMKGLTALHLAA